MTPSPPKPAPDPSASDDAWAHTQVEAFCAACRAEFDDMAWALGVREVAPTAHRADAADNPFCMRFADAQVWYALEGIHWGFGLSLTFGQVAQPQGFSLINALWLLEGPTAAAAHARRYQTPGSARALRGHVAAMERHPWFFEGRGWLDHTSGLRAALAAAARAIAALPRPPQG